MHRKILDRVTDQIEYKKENMEMMLCLLSFLLVPMFMILAIPLFPLHGIWEYIVLFAKIIFALIFYFAIGLKLIQKHFDKYTLKLIFEEFFDDMPIEKFNTKWRKSKNKSYKKLGFIASIDLKTNNVYITKNEMMNNYYTYNILDLEILDDLGRKIFIAKKVKTKEKPKIKNEEIPTQTDATNMSCEFLMEYL